MLSRFKYIILLIGLISFYTSAYCQQKILDFTSKNEWPRINVFGISNDGKYNFHVLEFNDSRSVLNVQQSGGKIIYEEKSVNSCSFTTDSKRAVFMKPGDSLCLLTLKNKSLLTVPGIKSFYLPEGADGKELVCSKAAPEGGVFLINLLTLNKIEVKDVYWFKMNKQGTTILYATKSGKDGQEMITINWMDVKTKFSKKILDTEGKIQNFIFDNTGSGCVGIIENNNANQLYYYSKPQEEMKRLTIVDKQLGDSLEIYNGKLGFNTKGNRIFIPIGKKKSADQIHDTTLVSTDVEIWSYMDNPLFTQQDVSSKQYFTGVINTDGSNLFILDSGRLEGAPDVGTVTGNDQILISTNKLSYEREWNIKARQTHYVVSILDGSRSLVKENGLTFVVDISPGGHFVIYYDRDSCNYFTYEIKTGITRSITPNIKSHLYFDEDEWPKPALPFGVAGWSNNDSALYIYDRYDIWKVDPYAHNAAINITHEYGMQHKIVFRCINNDLSRNLPNHRIILSAFNRTNKKNGFYYIDTGKDIAPVELTMGDYIYYYKNYQINGINPDLPIKAGSVDAYILKRMSSREFPNLMYTRDFKSFIQLTNYKPEEKYNWCNSELVHWPLPDGKMAEGILYKPDDFDSTKKYPVIFHFYEKESDALNNYIYPDLSDGNLNIPWFVSNGYLIFSPNMYYRKGLTAGSVKNSIESAFTYLSNYKWIDTSNIGILGFSFGGYEVNVAISNTHLFKAAVACAGMSDLVSSYGGIGNMGNSLQFHFENYQVRLGTAFSDNPDVYVDNSPIFKLANITTPLLIMHNKEDYIIPWGQSVELFTGLRRIRKKVWMLQYNGEGHGLGDEKNKLDFSIRIKQFFDYFLKGMKPPFWMENSIPRYMSGKVSGF